MAAKKEVKNKLVFVTKDVDGKELQLAVKNPNAVQLKELQAVYNREYKEALDSGAILRAKVEDIARQQGLWNDEKEAEFKKLNAEIFASELKLLKGGAAGLSKKTARALALKMGDLRAQVRRLLSSRNEIDLHTAETQAENARFNHMVAMCTLTVPAGDKYFKDFADYSERYNTETACIDAARHMALLQNALDPDWEAKLPENKFLKEHGFVNDKLRLINKEGKLIDAEGRLIREDGRFINEKNELIDSTGNPVDEEGNYIVVFKPFLEDEEEVAK